MLKIGTRVTVSPEGKTGHVVELGYDTATIQLDNGEQIQVWRGRCFVPKPVPSRGKNQ